MKLIVFTLVLSLCAPAFAQDSEPFELLHPDTNERGMWTPEWLVREHLRTEADLRTCEATRDTQREQIGKKDVELELRHEALQEQKKASEELQLALTTSVMQLEEEKKKNALVRWVYAGGTLVSATVVVLTLTLKKVL